MIISHTHKYIFIKSLKTAGTSIEAALSAYCMGDDIVTELGDYHFNRDAEGNWIHHAMNSSGFEQHDDAAMIKSKLPDSVWSSYLKFSIARNPWDRTVSLFFWEKKRKPETKPKTGFLQRLGFSPDEHKLLKREFREFVLNGRYENNDRFYFMNDRPCVDYIIRYENLSEDLDRLCDIIGLPHLNLPKLKSGIRKDRSHYSSLYDIDTIEAVANKHKLDIAHFGYFFERIG